VLKFIIKRLLILIPLMLGVSLVVFLMLHYGPNDPAISYVRLSGIPPTDEAIIEARHTLGLDRPLAVQYFSWLGKAIRLDFGTSFVAGAPVLDLMLHYFPNTLYLAAVSMLMTLLISIPMGVYSAVKKDKLPDHICRAVSYVGVATPSFWLAFLLILLLSIKLGWLPPMGFGGVTYVLMPAFTAAFMSTCINMRLIRGNMLDQMHTRHLLYARIRGVKEPLILRDHIFRNSLIPVITVLGMHLGEILGGAVIAETVFAWPGVGRYALSAINNRDFPVIQCFVLMMTGIFVLCNLVTDILYAALDPRIRLEGEQSHA
jgi:nickel transport system permease protein